MLQARAPVLTTRSPDSASCAAQSLHLLTLLCLTGLSQDTQQPGIRILFKFKSCAELNGTKSICSFLCGPPISREPL